MAPTGHVKQWDGIAHVSWPPEAKASCFKVVIAATRLRQHRCAGNSLRALDAGLNSGHACGSCPGSGREH